MNDMKLQMIVTGDNSGLNAMLNKSDAAVRKFTSSAVSHFTKLQTQANKVWSAMGNASAATKMIGVGIGMGSLKSIIDENLEFERTMLRMKFNAQMTTKEVAQLREEALKLSKVSLTSPMEIANMEFRLANDNLKIESIRKMGPTIAMAAQVFEAPAEDMANMSVDIMQKMGLKEEQMPRMLNMLYYHATHGRFMTKDMAEQAPEFLNSGKFVGITGETGLNFMGALTQRMMRNATVHNPAGVSTFIEHGLSHITQPHYLKGLQKFGINVMDYFDASGKHLKGEGGVDGLIELAKAMKAKNLDNPFNLGKAGFREHYAQVFWREMMESITADDSEKNPNLIKMMERGKEAANEDQLGKNLQEVREANFGKIKAAEIEVDKAKLSSGGQALAEGAGTYAGTFSAHPVATVAATVGAVLAANEGKKLIGKLLARGKGGMFAKAVEEVGGIGGSGTPVMVTNWPSGFGGPVKASERMSRVVRDVATTGGAGVTGAAATATATGSAALAAAVPGTIGLGGLGLTIAATKITQAHRDALVSMTQSPLGAAFAGEYGVAANTLEVSSKTTPEMSASHTGMEKVIDRISATLVRWLGGDVADSEPAATSKSAQPGADDTGSKKLPAPDGTKSTGNETGNQKLNQLTQSATPPQDIGKQAAALAASQARWQTEIQQLDQTIDKAKLKQDTDLLAKLDKQRTDLVAKLDSVIQALADLNKRPVQVSLDSKPIVAAVNTANGRDARRQ